MFEKNGDNVSKSEKCLKEWEKSEKLRNMWEKVISLKKIDVINKWEKCEKRCKKCDI